MMKFKKVKPFLLGLSLISVGGLSACNKNEEPVNTEKVTEMTQTETTEEKLTEEAKTEISKEEEKEIKFYNLAAESYNNYTEFYAKTKMAYKDENARDGINITRIENMIKVINGEVADLTEDEVKNAKEDMNYILLSQDLAKDVKFIHEEENGYIEISGKFELDEFPKLSMYAVDKETIEITKKYEDLRDKVVNDINLSKNLSEEIKKELKDAVIEMEIRHISKENVMNGDVTSEGNKLLENLAIESLIELTVGVTNESHIETDSALGVIRLIPETDEERDVESKVLKNGIEILTDEEKEIYAQSANTMVYRYEEGVCSHLQNLIDHAKSNTNVHSKKEELIKLREQLVAMNEENKLIYTI